MKEDEIRNTFKYHSPDPDAVATHEVIRELMTETVVTIAGSLPSSRERSLFITLMQQAQMMANAAIAIHGFYEISTVPNKGLVSQKKLTEQDKHILLEKLTVSEIEDLMKSGKPVQILPDGRVVVDGKTFFKLSRQALGK